MNFKAELVKELGLGAIAEATMLDDYVKACEAIAVRYHESEVKKLTIHHVSNSLNLCELERKLDEALGKETRETLTEWIKKQRQ